MPYSTRPDFYEEELRRGELQRGPKVVAPGSGFDMDFSGLGEGAMMQAPSAVRNIKSAVFNGGDLQFDSSNATGLAPGESVSVGPGGARLQGTNAGVNIGTRGTLGATYTPDDRSYTVGVDAQLPVNGMEQSIRGNFSVGTPRAPYGQGMPGDVVGEVDRSLGEEAPAPRMRARSAAQEYLRNQLDDTYGGPGGYPIR
jgi:hypothetical protein